MEQDPGAAGEACFPEGTAHAAGEAGGWGRPRDGQDGSKAEKKLRLTCSFSCFVIHLQEEKHIYVGNSKECSNCRTVALVSHTSKVMLKILQARLQQHMNQELPHVQAGFRKGGGTRDQIANINWIIEKAREFQKDIYFCFIDYTEAFDCVEHNKLWKILREMGIPDHLTRLLRNLYAGQEATVRTRRGTVDWFTIGEGVCQGHFAYLIYMQRCLRQ